MSKSGYEKGQDILLISCHTGRNPSDFFPNSDSSPLAQEISNEEEAIVYAPTGYVGLAGVRNEAFLQKARPWDILHTSGMLPWSDKSIYKKFTSENK